jgi:type I restriction enzyme S subunit
MLERPTFKAGWTHIRFDQIATQINDRVDNPAEAGVDRYVGLEHLDPDSLRIRRWGEPTDVESTKLRFQPGDIIFGKRRVYQRKVAVADFEGICSAHAMVLRTRPGAVLPDFLPFFMQSDLFMERALSISVGSLSPTINWTALAAEEFLLPPIQEQARLVTAFDAAEKVVAELENMAASAKRLWLATIEDFEQSSNTALLPLGDLLLGIEGGSSFVGIDEAPKGNEVAVIKISAIDPMGFNSSEVKVLINQDEFRSDCRIKKGDLLFSRANTSALVGECCLVDEDYPNLMLSDKTLRLIPRNDVPNRLLWHLLQSQAVRRQISSMATGTGSAMKNISQPKIRLIRVGWVEQDAQRGERVEAFDKCFSAVQQSIRRLNAFKTFQRRLVNSQSEGSGL